MPTTEAPQHTEPPVSELDRPRAPERLRGIVSAIEEEIVLGWLQPRERLVEEELSARFATKRHVIREAISELERLGLVERQANKGATVKALGRTDVEQIYTVRQALESLAAQQLPLPCDTSLLETLTAIQAVHSRAVASADPRAAFRANMSFHETFFAACGNPHLADAIRLFAQRVHGARSFTAADPVYLRRAAAEHEEMIAALRRGDRERLVALCRDHLGPSRDAYLDAVQRGRGPHGVLRRS